MNTDNTTDTPPADAKPAGKAKKLTKANAEQLARQVDAGLATGRAVWFAHLDTVRNDPRGYVLRAQMPTPVVGALARNNLVDKSVAGRIYVTDLGYELLEALG